MQKTITFLEWNPKRDFHTDNFVCRVKFSIIDTALVGTPRERENIHIITITITDILLSKWHVPGGLDFGITDEMIKVALQSLEDHLTQQIKQAPLPDGEQKPIILNTKNSPGICPYKLANILYPSKASFVVETEDQDSQRFNTSQVYIGGNITGSTVIVGNDNKVQSSTKIGGQSSYAKIKQLMPALIDEMRQDLLKNPTTREFVILKRSWVYNSKGPYLAYYLDEHADLEGKLQVLENLGLVQEITYNNVRRYLFKEELVDYLTGK